MSGQRKVYVIDPVNTKAKVDMSIPAGKEGRAAGGNPGVSQDAGSRDGKASAAKASDRESGVSLLLSYMAGPLSIFATRRGRKSRPWGVIAVVSVILSMAAIVMWRRESFWSSHDEPAGAILLTAAIVAVISGCLAWSRAVILSGRHEGTRLRRSPGWMRRPLAAGIFGTVCPGMGLYAAGRSRQAAAALWMAGLTVISFIMISKSAWLWDFNTHAGAFAISPDRLEYVLAGASLLAALGVVAWTVQALNGMRLAAPAKDRRPDPGKNWAAVALLASLAAFSIFFRPVMIAEALDAGASVAESRGMRIIPLHMSLVAARLDPSRPEYTVKAIGL
ncbi:MAG TPA: hypothetical protein VLA34_09680, partial [Candidatus Krumholzibacterium sp.]|nr:hypothetical protein [Candidatus Krumholzibacterium sp.]